MRPAVRPQLGAALRKVVPVTERRWTDVRRVVQRLGEAAVPVQADGRERADAHGVGGLSDAVERAARREAGVRWGAGQEARVVGDMSETVWKFVLGLADLQALDLPEDAEILHVADQFGEIAMWVRLDPNAASTMRRFTVIGTGHIVPPNST